MSTAGIPPEILAQYPAMAPPNGLTSNFNSPPSQKEALLGLNISFLTLMWIVVSMRLYAKSRILRTMGWDDYFCAMAALASTAHTGVMLNNISLGYGRHLWDIRAITLLRLSNVRRLSATSLIYPIVIFFVKISILLLYNRIFGVYRSVRIAVYIGVVILALFYIAYVGVQAAFLVECVTTKSLSTPLCRNVYAVTVFQSVFNVCSDFYVFAIPLPRIMKLHITRRQRIGLLFIFFAGLVACLVSVARLILISITFNRQDKFWWASMSSELTIVEINLAIIAACMSTLPGFFARTKVLGSSIFRSLRTRLFSSGTRSSKAETTSSKHSDVAKSPESIHDKNYIELMDGNSSINSSDTMHPRGNSPREEWMNP